MFKGTGETCWPRTYSRWPRGCGRVRTRRSPCSLTARCWATPRWWSSWIRSISSSPNWTPPVRIRSAWSTGLIRPYASRTSWKVSGRPGRASAVPSVCTSPWSGKTFQTSTVYPRSAGRYVGLRLPGKSEGCDPFHAVCRKDMQTAMERFFGIRCVSSQDKE